MRGHLLKCLTQGSFTMFPTLPDEMQSLQNCLELQADNQKNLNKSKENCDRKLIAELSFNIKLNNKNRNARQRKGLTPEQKVKANAVAKDRMKQYRKSVSLEQQMQIQKKDKGRKKDWRDTLTPEQQAQENAEAKLRMEQFRKSSTPEPQAQIENG